MQILALGYDVVSVRSVVCGVLVAVERGGVSVGRPDRQSRFLLRSWGIHSL